MKRAFLFATLLSLTACGDEDNLSLSQDSGTGGGANDGSMTSRDGGQDGAVSMDAAVDAHIDAGIDAAIDAAEDAAIADLGIDAGPHVPCDLLSMDRPALVAPAISSDDTTVTSAVLFDSSGDPFIVVADLPVTIDAETRVYVARFLRGDDDVCTWRPLEHVFTKTLGTNATNIVAQAGSLPAAYDADTGFIVIATYEALEVSGEPSLASRGRLDMFPLEASEGPIASNGTYFNDGASVLSMTFNGAVLHALLQREDNDSSDGIYDAIVYTTYSIDLGTSAPADETLRRRLQSGVVGPFSASTTHDWRIPSATAHGPIMLDESRVFFAYAGQRTDTSLAMEHTTVVIVAVFDNSTNEWNYASIREHPSIDTLPTLSVVAEGGWALVASNVPRSEVDESNLLLDFVSFAGDTFNAAPLDGIAMPLGAAALALTHTSTPAVDGMTALRTLGVLTYRDRCSVGEVDGSYEDGPSYAAYVAVGPDLVPAPVAPRSVFPYDTTNVRIDDNCNVMRDRSNFSVRFGGASWMSFTTVGPLDDDGSAGPFAYPAGVYVWREPSR